MDEPIGFDLWLKRALKERYGGTAREEVPEILLKLLPEDARRD